jgi:hypothetical protein
VRWSGEVVDHGAVKLRDERYLFHLTPWAYFPLWLGVSMTLGWLLEDSPFWLRLLIVGPIAWTLPFYMARMPIFARLAARRRKGASRWTNGPRDERWR